ncbi:MAG: LysE family transporter [Gammaproteobacteria bacterium]
MSEFFIVTSIIMLAAISPGPDFAMVSKNAVFYSRRAGIYTALGVSTSLLIHSIYCLFGLAIIISQSLLLFSIIKYLGAGYLIYIGIKSLFSKRDKVHVEESKSRKQLSAYQAFRQGLLCNLLNPKAIMFLLAFFTVILKPSTALGTQMIYSLEIAVIHMIWFSLLTMMMTHRVVKSGIGKVQFYFVKLMGALLVGFGVRIATLQQMI